MNFAMFRCCIRSEGLEYCEKSTDAVLSELGVGFTDIPDFKCCGFPLRNYSFKAYALSSAWNLAVAGKRSLDILTVCNRCYGALRHIDLLMKEDAALREEINETLAKGGLKYEGHIRVRHLLEVLHDDIGMETLSKKIRKRFDGLRVAVHYGCHLLRPRRVVGFDNPFSPSKLDRLVEVTGAESVPWRGKLDCCGSALLGVNDELSLDLAEKKLSGASRAGADCMCVVCPYCRIQFGRVQEMLLSRRAAEFKVPPVLFTQLLGLSLGLDERLLGLKEGQIPSKSASMSLA